MPVAQDWPGRTGSTGASPVDALAQMPTAAPSALLVPGLGRGLRPGRRDPPRRPDRARAVGAHDLRAAARARPRGDARGRDVVQRGRRAARVRRRPRAAGDRRGRVGRGSPAGSSSACARSTRFVADVHGPQRIIADGVMPGRVLGGAEYYEPELAGLRPPGRRWIGVAGFDIVRDDDGVLAVLEDNLRTPSGIAFAIATRAALRRDPARGGAGRRAAGRGRGRRCCARRCCAAVPEAAPDPSDPHVVLLTDGAANSAHWEHAWLARALGIPLARPADLQPRGDRVLLRGRRGRSTSSTAARTRTAATRPSASCSCPPCARARSAWSTRSAPASPTTSSRRPTSRTWSASTSARSRCSAPCPTYDLARAFDLREALDRFEELVVKPRSGSGGRGVVINPHAKPEDVEAVRRAVVSDPGAWVAQPMICLSTHPTVIDGRLQPRHVDLRPFVLADGRRARAWRRPRSRGWRSTPGRSW